ncbi:MAG: hypothetical protein ACREQ2_00235 [Candidatus Binatia bacterium]
MLDDFLGDAAEHPAADSRPPMSDMAIKLFAVLRAMSLISLAGSPSRAARTRVRIGHGE